MLDMKNSINRPSMVFAVKQTCSTIRDGSLFSYFVAGDNLFIPEAAIFDDALLCLVIDIGNAKASAVAKRPLEIIHQCPDGIAAQGDAFAERPVGLEKMFAQVVLAAWIMD